MEGSGCIGPRFLDLGTSWGELSASRSCRFIPGEKGLLDFGTSWSELSASRSCRFTPGEIALRFPLDRTLGGPQSLSGQHGKIKILVPTETRTPAPRSSNPQPVTILTTLPLLAKFSLRYDLNIFGY
jgi:hypothetical protein